MYYTSVECRQACSQREKSISYFQKEVEPDFFMYFCSLAEKNVVTCYNLIFNLTIIVFAK